MKYYVIYAVVTLINAFIVLNIVNICLMGLLHPKFSRKLRSNKFFVSPMQDTVTVNGTFFETQGEVECAGFSSAFLLRHNGIAARGFDIYREVPGKFGKGYVRPNGISKYFNKEHKAVMRTGNITALKNEIAKGSPVIVMIRSRIGSSSLHFVCVTGYDEDNFFIAESVDEFKNVSGKYYNRKISAEDFKKLWNTSMFKMPLYKNIFYEITL